MSIRDRLVSGDARTLREMVLKFHTWVLTEHGETVKFVRLDDVLALLGIRSGGHDLIGDKGAAPQTSWKGVRWEDSVKMSTLAEEIALHFAHDCEDSMCGEDSDESTCETAWIESKLTDFLEAQAANGDKGAAPCQDYIEYVNYVSVVVARNEVPMTFVS